MPKWFAAVAAVAGLLILTGCTAPHPSVTDDPDPSPTAAAVSGTIVEVGGPVTADGGQPTPRLMSAMAFVYRATDADDLEHAQPVARSASSTTSFSFAVPAGRYVIVAKSAEGVIETTPERVTVSDGDAASVNLQIDVP